MNWAHWPRRGWGQCSEEKRLAADRLKSIPATINVGPPDKMCKRLRSQPSGDRRLVEAAALFCCFASFLIIFFVVELVLWYVHSGRRKSETTRTGLDTLVIRPAGSASSHKPTFYVNLSLSFFKTITDVGQTLKSRSTRSILIYANFVHSSRQFFKKWNSDFQFFNYANFTHCVIFKKNLIKFRPQHADHSKDFSWKIRLKYQYGFRFHQCVQQKRVTWRPFRHLLCCFSVFFLACLVFMKLIIWFCLDWVGRADASLDVSNVNGNYNTDKLKLRSVSVPIWSDPFFCSADKI